MRTQACVFVLHSGKKAENNHCSRTSFYKFCTQLSNVLCLWNSAQLVFPVFPCFFFPDTLTLKSVSSLLSVCLTWTTALAVVGVSAGYIISHRSLALYFSLLHTFTIYMLAFLFSREIHNSFGTFIRHKDINTHYIQTGVKPDKLHQRFGDFVPK